MVEQSAEVPTKKARVSLNKAQEQVAIASPDDLEVIVLPEDYDAPKEWFDPDELVPPEKLIGFDPKRKIYRFISPTPSLLMRFEVPRVDKQGDIILTQLGAKVYNTIDVKFKNGVAFVKERETALLMLRHICYGGAGEKTTVSSEPLYWLDNYPAHEWETIKRRQKFITREENEHEG